MKKLSMLLIAVGIIFSMTVVSVGAYTDYVANAQKLVNRIWQTGEEYDGEMVISGAYGKGNEVFTAIFLNPLTKNLTFSVMISSTSSSIKSTCWFVYDTSTATVGSIVAGISKGAKHCTVILPVDIRTYKKDDYPITGSDILGDYIGPNEMVAQAINSTVKLAITSLDLFLYDQTGLFLVDIGFASLDANSDTSHAKQDGYTTIYAPDGRTAQVASYDVDNYLKAGWYDKPVTVLYAPDDRTVVVYTTEVESYKAVGWNTVPAITMYDLSGNSIRIWSDEMQVYDAIGWYLGSTPITMYAMDGRAIQVTLDQVVSYQNVGWFLWNTPITMYAPDGRTVLILIEQINAYLSSGWSQYPIAA